MGYPIVKNDEQGTRSFYQKNEQHTDIVRAYVTRCVDGDTIEVTIPRPPQWLEETEKIRLIGVDTPETKHPTKKVEYFGKEASAYTKKEILNSTVRLEFDESTRDRYGRLLAYVFREEDDFFLNYKLIYNGYGFAYTKYPFKYKKKFVHAEKSARERAVGLWERRERK